MILNIRFITALLALTISANVASESATPLGSSASLTDLDREEVYGKAHVWLEGFLQGTEKPQVMPFEATVPILNNSGVLEKRSLTIVKNTNGVYVGSHLDLKSWPFKKTNHEFKHEDAVNWLFYQPSSRGIGVNFSACTLIKHKYPERAKKMIEKYKLDCD